CWQFPLVATAHALLTLGVAVIWALVDRRCAAVAYSGAYIMGAEVLWRLTSARVFWEFGKYAVVLLVGLALLRHPPGWRRTRLPLLYLLLLLPAGVLTVQALGVSLAAREALGL